MMLKAGGMILLAAVFTYSHNSRTMAKENIPPLIFAPGYGMSALRIQVNKRDGASEKFNFLLPAFIQKNSLPAPAKNALDYAILSGLKKRDKTKVRDWLKLNIGSNGQVSNNKTVNINPISVGIDIESECPRYSKMARKLQTYGWISNRDLFCLPYDYRYPPGANSFRPNLIKLVERVYKHTNGKKVILACHSQGCLMAYHALRTIEKDWIRNHIQLFFAFAGQFSGCSDCLRWAFQKQWSWDGESRSSSPSDMSWAGELALDLQPSVYANNVLYRNGAKEYLAKDTRQLLKDVGAISMLRATDYYALSNQNWFRKGEIDHLPLPIRSRFIYGNGIPTTIGFDYQSISHHDGQCVKPSCAGFLNSESPNQIQADGDGGDSKWMNEAPMRWTSNPACEMRVLPDVGHMEIIENDEAIAHLAKSTMELAAIDPCSD
ncbi:lipase/acyltransferase domain-containing protein [Prochlorococcus sp. MIT 0702]|nr:hypothetical protein [Prochlorococcus sp. MIT 0702]